MTVETRIDSSFARTVFLIVNEVFLAPRDALEIGHGDICSKSVLSCDEGHDNYGLAVMTHLAGLCVDDPTRDNDGCSLVHEARLCDDAQEGHGRHIESCETFSHLEHWAGPCRTSDIIPIKRT
jgi:hypothetical protein